MFTLERVTLGRRAFLFFFVLFIPSLLFGADYTVSTPVSEANIEAAIATAYANVATGPHNVIIPNGSYSIGGVIDVTAAQDAQSGKEITIKAETAGSVTFNGNTRWRLYGDYWILQDLKITGFEYATKQLIEVTGANCRVTNNHIYDNGTTNEFNGIIWATETADNIEIDHNNFDDNGSQSGVFLGNNVGDVLESPHVHHNTFSGSSYHDGINGGNDALYLGGILGVSSDNEMNAIVEYNIFQDFHGSGEMLLVKCSNNTIRYNIFNDTYWLSLRLGDDNLIFNNWWFGSEGAVAYGIKLCGENHKVVNNYFYNLDGPGYIIQVRGGDSNEPDVVNFLLQSNTFAYIEEDILRVGDGVRTPPTGTKIYGNLMHADNGEPIVNMLDAGTDLDWSKNVLYTTGTYFIGETPDGGWPSDSADANQLTSGEFAGLWTTWATSDWPDLYVLDSSNEAIDAGYYDATYLYDFQGHTRGNPQDAGCDDYDTSAISIIPIRSTCALPSWWPGYECDDVVTAGTVFTAVGGGNITEAEVLVGGDTVIYTVAGDTFDADLGTDCAEMDAFIAGITCTSGVQANGFAANVAPNITFDDFSLNAECTELTWTIDANAGYSIDSNEIWQTIVPAVALTGGDPITAEPNVMISNIAAGGQAGVGTLSFSATSTSNITIDAVNGTINAVVNP